MVQIFLLFVKIIQILINGETELPGGVTRIYFLKPQNRIKTGVNMTKSWLFLAK